MNKISVQQRKAWKRIRRKIKMSSGKSDINFIKPLYALANFMAIVPPNDPDDTKLTKHKCYSVFVTVLILCAYSFFMIYKGNIGDPSNMETMVVLNVLHFTLSATVIVIAILISSFYNIQEFKTFITGVNEFDRYFEENCKPSKQFFFELFVIHAIYICIVVYDVYNAVSLHELYYYGKVIFSAIETYFIKLLVLLMYNYCRVLKLRFKTLNHHLQNFLSTPNIIKSNDPTQRENFKNYSRKAFNTIGEARKLYNQLTHLTKSFSKLFGWQILFFFAIIAVGLLELVDAILLNYLDLNNNIVVILLITSFSIMGIVLAVTCDMTTKEARRTATVCYNLLLDIPTATTNMQDRVTRDELILLAQQAVHECPRFSAAGFFTVDYTVLFGLLATVTSYVIVLIQLNER